MSGRIVLEFFALLPGDFNQDSIVEAADYVVWRKNDGSPGGYNTWRANFGTTPGSGSSLNNPETTPAVPEPTSLVLAAIAALAIGRIRREASGV